MHQVDEIHQYRIGSNSKQDEMIQSVRRIIEIGNLGLIEVHEDRLKVLQRVVNTVDKSPEILEKWQW
jgi:hypothetical protein